MSTEAFREQSLDPQVTDQVRRIAGQVARETGEGALLPILHAVNDTVGWVPDAAVPVIAEVLNLSRADVHGVLTFYHDFRRTPPRPHRIRLCRAEACQARGADALAAHAEAALGSGRSDVGLEAVYCLGLCASGPAAEVDGRQVARLTPGKLDRLLAEMAS